MAINKNKIVAQAQKLIAKGQFEKAIIEYQKLLKVEPNDIRTWLKIGDLYTRMGARKEATDTYLRVAGQYTKSGFHLKAIAVYKQVLKIDPSQIEIYQHLANSYLDLGLTSEALIQLEQLVDMYQRTNRDDLLLKSLIRMSEIDSHNIATKLRIAEHLSKENRTREAVEQFTGACAELKNQGRIEDFLKVAERLLYHDSTNVDLARELAEIYLERKQHKHALAKLQACFVKNPRDLYTLELLAKAFQGLGQPDKAISVYKEMYLLLTGPEHEDKQKPVLEAILALDPKNKYALDELNKGSHSEEAQPDLPMQTEEIPEVEPPAEVLGDEDYKELSNVDSLTEEEIEAKAEEILQEADILAKYGLMDRALDHVKRIFEFYPYCIDARERMRDILLEMGRKDEAIEQLFFLVDLFADSQPEGAVYYLHEILGIDPTIQKARENISELGGVMPDELEESEVTLDEEEEDLQILEDDEDVYVLEDEPLESVSKPPDSIKPPAPPTRSSIPGGLSAAVRDYAPEVLKEPESELGDLDLSSDLDDFDMTESHKPLTDLADEEQPPEKPPFRASSVDFDADTMSEPEPEIDLEELDDFSIEDDDEIQLDDDEISIEEEEEFHLENDSDAKEAEELPDIDDELEEVEFFIEQGLMDEGKAALKELSKNHPNDARVQGALDNFKKTTTKAEIESKRRITHVEQEQEMDTETQYDLGIAYKEMGLFEKAIKEFEKAAKNPAKAALANMMIGMCYNNLDRKKEAITTFIKGLKTENLDKQHEHGLLYELGVTYQMMQKKKYALKCFKKIASTDPEFSDVSSRISVLVGKKSQSSRPSVF